MIDDKWLRRQYVAYNKSFFHGLLPPDLPVQFADIDDSWAGVTYFDRETKEAIQIDIDKGLRKLGRYAKIVLLHEMSHVSVGNKERQLHGPLWRQERKRLIDAGAYTPLL